MNAQTLLETEQSEPVRAYLQNIVDNPDPIWAQITARNEREMEQRDKKEDSTGTFLSIHDYQDFCNSRQTA